MLFTIDMAANSMRITKVTVASILAKAHEDKPVAFTSMIFTRKSSLRSCNTVMNRLAKKSISNTGMKLLNTAERPLRSRATRSVRNSISAFVGCGSRVIAHPNKESNGKANAPMNAGIQNSLT